MIILGVIFPRLHVQQFPILNAWIFNKGRLRAILMASLIYQQRDSQFIIPTCNIITMINCRVYKVRKHIFSVNFQNECVCIEPSITK